MAGSRTAKIELKTSAAGMDRGLADARRKLRTFEREQLKYARAAVKAVAREEEQAARDKKKGVGGAGNFLKGAAMGLGGAAGFDLAGGLGGLVSNVFDVEKELTRLQIDAQLSSDKLGEFRQEALKVSQATGVSRESIVHAAHAYQILTGDAQGAINTSRTFADVANASGASMEDIAASAASMKQNLGLDPSEFRKGFDVLLKLGHEGSVELRDVAGEMSGLAPQFKAFGDKGTLDKMAEMGAAMQVIRKNFANAPEMATGFKAAMTAISKTKVADKLAAHGVEVWKIDPKTGNHIKRDFFEIITDIKKKLPDQKVLADVLGGRQESFRAITAMLEHYEELVHLKDEAANSDQVSKDSAVYMASASGRIQLAWEHIKNAVAEALTPERIDAMASALMKAADAFAKVVGFIDKSVGVIASLPDLLTPEGREKQKEVDSDLYEYDRRVAHNTSREGGNADAAWADLSREDQLKRRLAAQTNGVNWATSGDTKRFGDAGGRKSVYSAQEISALMGSVGGASNWQSGLADQLGKAMAKALQDANIVVKADSNAIAQAGSNAKIHTTRPGGHR